MRLTLRQEWRPRALTSVLGFMDIKTGATIVILFALLNKVAGVYGLIAIFHGGTFAQLSMYIYSVAALAAFAWGMRAVTEEDPRKTLYFAHLFVGDHLLNTIWTTFFAVSWWVYNPHDGKRIANSDAQKDMMGSGGPTMTDEERKQAAQLIWNQEKGLAATVLIVGWLLKIYFAALLYSYAVHLRKGTYRSLPLSNPTPDPAAPFLSTSALADPAEEYELGDEERNYEQTRLPPTRRPNGTTRFPSASARIMHDLEAPMESVLWDDDEEAAEGTSSSSAPLKSVRTETSISEGESEGGDIAGSVPRSRIVEKGKSRFA